MAATVPAKTLKQTAILTGAGLHSGLTTTVRIHPAAAGSGLVFTRVDLPGKPRVTVQQIDHNAAPFRTVIKHGAAEIHTIEHLLSALAGLGITDCAIDIDGIEVPGMDGSSRDFVTGIQTAGIETLSSTVPVIAVSRPVSVEEGLSKMSAQPYAAGLKIDYTLHYAGNTLAQGTYSIDVTEPRYIQEIASARTFAMKKDAEQMRAAGLGKGANFQNTLIIDGDKALETDLRFSDEPVRHKILDLLGDLYILGCPVQGHITAHCSGHRTNRSLAMLLKKEFGG